MAKYSILLAGESRIGLTGHVNGFDEFSTAAYHTGADPFLKAMVDSEFEITFMPSHIAQREFPHTLEALSAYDAVILSDIGSNTLLLHPDTSSLCRPMPNRLRLLKDYVAAGGGLAMFGGYCSFQGFRGTARYHNTPIEDVLPVECLPYDDRVETPEGFRPVIVDASAHPILTGLSGEWPLLLGFNEVVAKPDALVLATATSDYRNLPLLVLGHHGEGRTLAWTTDIGPHWLPPDFSNWAGYRKLWTQALSWVIGDRAINRLGARQ